MKCKYCKDTGIMPKYFFAYSTETISCTECKIQRDNNIYCLFISDYGNFSFAPKFSLSEHPEKILYEGKLKEIEGLASIINSSPLFGSAGLWDNYLGTIKSNRSTLDIYYNKFNQHLIFKTADQEFFYKLHELKTNPSKFKDIIPVVEIHKKLGNI